MIRIVDSSTPLNDNSLQIESCNLIRADHPNDVKRGGVCIYYRESLPVRIISIPYLKEALLLELVQNNNKIFASVGYIVHPVKLIINLTNFC